MAEKISPQAMEFFQTDNKVGLIAVEDDDGCPHITMISTLSARNDHEMMFGQFCEGQSKEYIAKRPKTGFLVLSMDKELWRGRAVFSGTSTVGPEFDIFNNKPLFRYNSYFGIGKVYFMKLKDIAEEGTLPMNAIIRSALATRMKKNGVKNGPTGALNAVSAGIIGEMSSLKFLSVKDADGFCKIIPVIQAAPVENGSVAFALSPYREELKAIKPGEKAAIFSMRMDTVGVLVKGVYRGTEKNMGVLDIEKVYNPLMPLPGYVYPKPEIRPVTEFLA